MVSEHPVQPTLNKLPGSADPHSQPPSSFDPWILWVTFRRCWPWAVPIGTLLACVASIVVYESFVPRYRASHWLESKDDFLVYKGVMPTIADLAKAERDFFFDQIVLDPVLANPALRKAPSLADPESAELNLRKNLAVGSGGTKNRLVVTYDDTDAVAAKLVCNAVVDSYLLAREAFDNRRVDNLVRWLEPEVRNQEQVVEQKRQTFKSLSKNTLGYAPGERLSMLEDENKLAYITDLQSQITDLKVQIAVSDAESQVDFDVEFAQPQLPAFNPPPLEIRRRVPTESELLAAIEQDSKVAEARGKVEYFNGLLLDLEVRDAVWDRTRYKEIEARRDAALVALDEVRLEVRPSVEESLEKLADADVEQRKQLAELQILQRRSEFEQSLEISRLQSRRDRAEAVSEAAKEREELATRLTILEASYEDEKARLEQFAGESSMLLFAQQELELENSTLEKLRERVAAFRIERQNTGSVRSLAEAQTPRHPVETVPVKKILAASGAAFLIPFLGGFLWEFRVRRVTDSRAVENANLAPVVGELARLPSGKGSPRSRRIFEESVDSLRANLFLSTDTKDTRSIAVVSSMSGEGKSSVSSQLALSIAKATGETVLLVDTDLRCPDQHEIFGLDSGPGLSAVLSGAATLEEAIDRTLGDRIHVLPAGRLDRSPHRLMTPDSMRQLVDGALKSYRYVVFDTAPVLSAGESLAVASVVDSTLICVMRDVSRIDNVTRTTRRLEAAGARIIGAVFSGVSARQYTYRYGDYHYAVGAEHHV